MEVFDKALKKLLEHEGGYSNDSRDSGGETYRGVSRKWFPKAAIWSIIDTIEDKDTLQYNEELSEQVAAFYYAYFWFKLKCHLIEDGNIAEMIFITGVNLGKKVAVKKLQRILKVKQDGLIGNITIFALNSSDSEKFTYQFVIELIDFYVEVSSKGGNAVYLRGWTLRALSFYYSFLNHNK